MQANGDERSAELSALEETLALHLSQKELMPKSNAGRIDRSWYLSAAGISSSPEAVDIFDRFDKLAKDAMSIDDDVVRSLDLHIQHSASQKTLAIKSGVIVRQRVSDVFGLTRTALRHPLIISRFDFWDREIAGSNYVPDNKAITRENRERASRPLVRWSVFRFRTVPRYQTVETSLDRLKRVLSEHEQSGKFLRNSHGGLSSCGYAELIKVDRLSIDHRLILRDFQSRVGAGLSSVEAKIPQIKKWFADSVSKRTLPVFGSKIQLNVLRKTFSITLKQFVSCPPLLELIEKFNEELARRGYLGQDDFNLEKKLLQRISTAELHKTGLTIDRSKLARQLKCPLHVLVRRSPFKEHLDRADKEHRSKIANDLTWVYFEEFGVDFGPLIRSGWSEIVIESSCKAIRENFAAFGPKKRRDLCNSAFQLFNKLATVASVPVRSAFCAINQRGNLADQVWREALDELGTGARRNATIRCNSILDCLVREGIFPLTKNRIKLAPKRRTPNSYRTVAEVVPGSTKAIEVSFSAEKISVVRQYVSFANWVLLQKSSWSEGISEFRGDDFLAVLQAEVEKWQGVLPTDPVQAISQIIGRRLGLIAESAETLFAFWKNHYDEGQVLLSEGVDPELYTDIVFGADRTSPEYLQALSQYFPSDPERRRQGLANLVRLVHDRHGGLVPIGSGGEERFFALRCHQYASQVLVQAYLIPHRDAHAAAITMYLAESGCNPAVARTLYWDCIEETDMHGFCKITGYKARARGKPIVINLPQDSKAVEALCWLRDNNNIARQNASKNIRDLLFITRIGNEVVNVSAAWLLANFKNIVASISDLAGLKITPVMLRPSVLLRHALENDGDLRVGLAYGQHEPGETGSYQVRLPTKYIYDQLYSQFQKRFQKIVLGMAARLRGEEQSALPSSAKPIGIGGVCATGGCDKLDCWNSCSNLVVIPEINALADWQIWNRSLKEVRSEWEQNKIERWEAMWLPFLCFTDVLAVKMEQGSNELSRLWDAATKRAEELMSSAGFVMPRPF